MISFPLRAPFAAWAAPLSEVPDPAFAHGMLGNGIALDPLEGVVRAPCDAEVTAVAATGHSVTLRHASNVAILIHVGIDTVHLRGKGFKTLVAPGAVVETGDILLQFDLDLVARGATSLISPMVLPGDDARLADLATGRLVAAGENIATVFLTSTMKEPAAALPLQGAVAIRTLRVELANGLHARPCAQVGRLLKPFTAEVIVTFADRTANARSLTSLMKLTIEHEDTITVTARGPDACAALEAVASVILAQGVDAHDILPPVQSGPLAVPEPRWQPIEEGGISGIRAAPGGAMGEAFPLLVQDLPVAETRGSLAEEQAKLKRAISCLAGKLRELSLHSDIAEAHLSLLSDPDFRVLVDARIVGGASAAAAWRATTRQEMAHFEANGNPLFAARAADLLDVERQLIASLLNSDTASPEIPQGSIIIAEELLPSTFLELNYAHLAAIVTAKGGPTSHVALLAAAKGIPMLVACGSPVLDIAKGTPVAIDPDRPVLLVHPDPEVLAPLAWRIDELNTRHQAELMAAATDCFTADGQRIEIFANCGSSQDAATAAENGAEGCGLLRTEFLFLNRQQPPTIAEQIDCYRDIASSLAGRPIIVRTLDAGSDKLIPYLPVPREDNPSLGTRGIRLSLSRPELLEEQFVAILQAVPANQLRIMLPMVTELSELRAAKSLLRQAEERLSIASPAPLGIMVETPAAALLAEQLASEADFLSIGSNDLTQYVLAADRQNPALAAMGDALHPAVLRLIKLAADGAHAHGRWLGVCGSIASDPDAAGLLIGLGVDELSATPLMIPTIKARLGRLRTESCRELAARALNAECAGEVRRMIGA